MRWVAGRINGSLGHAFGHQEFRILPLQGRQGARQHFAIIRSQHFRAFFADLWSANAHLNAVYFSPWLQNETDSFR